MRPAEKPLNEDARLVALHEFQILDTPAEKAFDDLARLACYVCDAPIALVSFVDRDRQWMKAKMGLAISETSRDVAFCAHAILAPDDLLIVPDALLDERFVDNPLVTGEPKIRFYAGAPLVVEGGLAVGTLCVIDHSPKELSPGQTKALKILRNQVTRELELHKKTAELSEMVKKLEQTRADLAKSESRCRELLEKAQTFSS
jgi:GAF domain-containing protein